MELETVKRFAGTETLPELSNMAETIPANVSAAQLTDSGLIKYRCLCNRLSFHEVKTIGLIKSCTCGRCFAVPSPVELPLLAGTAVVRQQVQVMRTSKATLVYNSPIIAPADWHNATTPRSVSLPPRKSNLLAVFLLGLILGLGLLAIAGNLFTLFR